jgi:hypothetical protein
VEAPHVVGFAQSCAVARDVYQSGMTDADWTVSLKERLAKLGYTWESAESLTRAIRAVEAAHGRPAADVAPQPNVAPSEPAPLSRGEAKAVHDEWHAAPDPTLLDLARDAVRFYPGTDAHRCHVQLKAMEYAAQQAGIPFNWGKLSVALIKAQRELVLAERASA